MPTLITDCWNEIQTRIFPNYRHSHMIELLVFQGN